MRTAVIDLGTNTFNLLIVEIGDKAFKTLYSDKIAVKLIETGDKKISISPEAFKRGISAIAAHYEVIRKFDTRNIYAIATSGIRSSNNGQEFIQKLLTDFNIKVRVIDGNQEAELIYYGVKQTGVLGDHTDLVIDIGGGSVEFIICNQSEIFWKHSFEIGAARLLHKFNPSDPIKEDEINKITDYLAEQLYPLIEAYKNFNIQSLIGSSGTFDTLAEMISHKFYAPGILKGRNTYDFKLSDYHDIYDQLLKSTRAERLKTKGLIEMRVDMIVVSSILTTFILEKLGLKKMKLSTYALKEGVLFKIINDKF
jgi:exopolyphosphatase / guanosine-5'-triphosphate,3'-diphosphate pyrophosphatase